MTAHVVARAPLPQHRSAMALAAHVATLDAHAIVDSVASSYAFVAQAAPPSESPVMSSALCIYRSPRYLGAATIRASPVGTPHLTQTRELLFGAVLAQRWNCIIEMQGKTVPATSATTGVEQSTPGFQVPSGIVNRSGRTVRDALSARLLSVVIPSTARPKSDNCISPLSERKTQPLSELRRELAAASPPIKESTSGTSGRRQSLSPSKLRTSAPQVRGGYLSPTGAAQLQPAVQPLPRMMQATAALPLVFDQSDDTPQAGGSGSGVISASATFNHPSLFGSVQHLSGAHSDDAKRGVQQGSSLPDSFNFESLGSGPGPVKKSGPFLLTASAAKQRGQRSVGFDVASAGPRPSYTTSGTVVFSSQLGAPSAAQVGLPLWAALEAVKVSSALWNAV